MTKVAAALQRLLGAYIIAFEPPIALALLPLGTQQFPCAFILVKDGDDRTGLGLAEVPTVLPTSWRLDSAAVSCLPPAAFTSFSLIGFGAWAWADIPASRIATAVPMVAE